MSRKVQFDYAENPDGTVLYPDTITLFSDTVVHPQDDTKLVADYTGTNESILDFDGYFVKDITLNFRDFQRLFGSTVYNQILTEYNAGTDSNLNWFFDLARAYPATVQLSSPDTIAGLDILIANINISFTATDKEKILQNIAL